MLWWEGVVVKFNKTLGFFRFIPFFSPQVDLAESRNDATGRRSYRSVSKAANHVAFLHRCSPRFCGSKKTSIYRNSTATAVSLACNGTRFEKKFLNVLFSGGNSGLIKSIP